jgi:hypothetical protein
MTDKQRYYTKRMLGLCAIGVATALGAGLAGLGGTDPDAIIGLGVIAIATK